MMIHSPWRCPAHRPSLTFSHQFILLLSLIFVDVYLWHACVRFTVRLQVSKRKRKFVSPLFPRYTVVPAPTAPLDQRYATGRL